MVKLIPRVMVYADRDVDKTDTYTRNAMVRGLNARARGLVAVVIVGSFSPPKGGSPSWLFASGFVCATVEMCALTGSSSPSISPTLVNLEAKLPTPVSLCRKRDALRPSASWPHHHRRVDSRGLLGAKDAQADK